MIKTEFLLFYIQASDMQVLLNSWELFVKELPLNKISALQPANAIKTKFPANSLQGFFRNS